MLPSDDLLPHVIYSPPVFAGGASMKLISITTCDEVVVALAGRYSLGSQADRGRILDEFAALIGHHRKHAMRLLLLATERRT